MLHARLVVAYPGINVEDARSLAQHYLSALSGPDLLAMDRGGFF